MGMDRVAVLIPCFNEEETIKKVVLDWRKEIPDAVVYVYDNNSSDNTANEARLAGAIVRKSLQQGKGNVIRKMFREINAECYIMVDGDDTYPADVGQQLVNEVLNNQTDMVIGDRLSSTYFQQNKRLFHNFGNIIVRHFINSLFKSDIKDIMTGLRAFSFQFVKTFPVLSKGFEIETEMTIHAIEKNLCIKNNVIEYKDRREGSESKLNTYADGLKVIKTIFNLYKNNRPLGFFGSVAVVLLIIASLFLIPVLVNYFQTGLVPNFPTLIVCGFAIVASIISIFSGLILQTIVKKEKVDFEFKLQMVNAEYNRLMPKKDKKGTEI